MMSGLVESYLEVQGTVITPLLAVLTSPLSLLSNYVLSIQGTDINPNSSCL